MFQNGASLFERDAGKPLNELCNLRAVFKILEQRGNRHARPAEHPGSAHTLWIPLNRGTS